MRSVVILTAAAAVVLAASPAAAELAKCTMDFNLSGWSFGYKTTKGEGTISCSNGQKADVTISSHGGGLTAGKSDLLNGKGSFSEVKDIGEIFGTYAQAEASAKANKGGSATVMTKGEISLAISGTGRGWEAGASLGGFTIKKK